MDWSNCELVEVIPGKVSRAPLFRNSRLPVETITDNVDAYLNEGLPLDQAIAETLASFPSAPGGAEGVRSVVAYRAVHDDQVFL